MLDLELNLTENPPARDVVAAAVAEAAASGIRFFTLYEAGDTPTVRFKLYELVREGVVDDPSNDGTFMDYESFSEQLFEAYYGRWSECQFLAAEGDAWVGLSNVQLRDGNRAEFGVTVVKRGYRRRGIARALKLLALQYLHERGVRSVRTRNDPTNAAILRLNRALGFGRG
jgi:RimJ/RimL family protein N-acetyltransferase